MVVPDIAVAAKPALAVSIERRLILFVSVMLMIPQYGWQNRLIKNSSHFGGLLKSMFDHVYSQPVSALQVMMILRV
jgi:hypothetical protein